MRSTDGVGVGRGVHELDSSGNRLTATRKITRNGNGLMVCVPPAFLRRLNLYPGDRVVLIFDVEMDGFFVKPHQRRHFRPVEPPPAVPVTGEAR